MDPDPMIKKNKQMRVTRFYNYNTSELVIKYTDRFIGNFSFPPLLRGNLLEIDDTDKY